MLQDAASMTYLFLRGTREIFLSGLFSFCMQNSSGNFHREQWGWFSGRRQVTNFMNSLIYDVWDIQYIPSFKGMFCMCTVWKRELAWSAENPGMQGHWEAEELATVPGASSAQYNDSGLKRRSAWIFTRPVGNSLLLKGKFLYQI